MTKINISQIIIEHLKSQFTHLSDYILFLVLPTVIAGLLYYFEVTFKSQIGIIISSLSIFIGLFINVIVLLFDILRRDSGRAIKVRLIHEIMANISFAVLLSGIAIILLLATKIDHILCSKIFNALSVFILVWITLTILMILKRIYVLFTDEINQGEKNKK